MPRSRPLKTNFTNGEVDPVLFSRSDLELSVNGAAYIRNALPFPQGGVRRRDGLESVTRIPPIGDEVTLRLINPKNEGTGYTVNDTITISGGTGTSAQVQVDSIGNSGQIRTITVLNNGEYTAPPTSPAASTGGTGNGATFYFSLKYLPDISKSLINVSSASTGSGYAVGDEITASGGTLDDSGPNLDTEATPLKLRIVDIDQSSLPTFQIINIGDYKEYPPNLNGIATTGGSGSGLTLQANADEQDVIKMETFSFSLDQNYLLVFTVGRWYVFRKEDTGDGPNELVAIYHNAPWSNEQLNELTFTQSLDTMFIFHKDLPTRRLVRKAEASWELTEWTPNNVPSYAFGVTQEAQLNIAANVFDDKVVGDEIVITATSASFSDPGDEGKYIRIISAPDGDGNDYSSYYRIKDVNSSTSVDAEILVFPLLVNSDAISVGASNWLLEEEVWAPSIPDEEGGFTFHGYPRCGAFYQGRLWVAGTNDLPQSLWSSRAGDINDFNGGTNADDLGIFATADSGTQSTFQNIYPGRHLQLFADNAEFYIPLSQLEPITPSNITLRRTSSVGSVATIPPFEIDGTVYFAQKLGQSYREFVYSDTVDAYEANPVSVLASHLIKGPIDAAYKESLDTQRSNYIWIVNGDDYSLTAFCILKSEVINAWSNQTTEGEFRGVAVSDQDSYFNVRRWAGGLIRDTGYFKNLIEVQGNNANPQGVAQSGDGSTILVVDNKGDACYEYKTTYSNSLKRVVYSGNRLDLNDLDFGTPAITNPKDIVLKPDGKKVFFQDLTVDKIFEADMINPNSLSPGNVVPQAVQFLDYGTEIPTGTGFDISPDGTRVVIIGTGADKIGTWTLNTPWTFRDGYTHDDAILDISNIETSPQDVKWTGDVKGFVVAGSNSEKILLFRMDEEYDIANAELKAEFDVSEIDTNPFGLSFSQDYKNIIWAGAQKEQLYQLELSNSSYFGEFADWIEFFQTDLKFDAAVCKFSGIDIPESGITGALQLANETVGLIIDNEVFPDQQVDEFGDLTFPVTAKYNYQVGLPFPNVLIPDVEDESAPLVDTGYNVFIQTLPADIQLPEGSNVGKRKRVVDCAVRYYQTQGFYLNDRFFVIRNLPFVLDRPIPRETGEKRVKGLLGWTKLGQITIGQKEPLDMTIEGLAYGLSTTG